MSNVYKKEIGTWYICFVFIKNKGILIIFETLSATEEGFFEAPFFSVMCLSLPEMLLSKVSSMRSFIEVS